MSIWFLNDNNRLSVERNAIEKLDQDSPWIYNPTWTIAKGKLSVAAVILVDEKRFPVIVEYPALFPAIPATVLPQEKNEFWSEHQYQGTGELCLEWGPDNWDPNVTGADLLRSAHKLLLGENKQDTGDLVIVASRHVSSIGQKLRNEYIRAAIISELAVFLENLPDKARGSFKYWLTQRDRNATLHFKTLTPINHEVWESPPLPKSIFLAKGFEHQGRFLKIDIPLGQVKSKSYSELMSHLRTEGLEDSLPSESEDRVFSLLLVINSSSDLALFILPKESNKKLTQIETFHVTTEDHQRSGVNSELISGKSVGIVGLGSAGSKMAITLARTGIREFFLIDEDVFLIENIERHTLDYRNLGEHKVDGVKGQLEAISSEVTVNVARLKITGQEASSSVSRRLNELIKCDLIIDTTGDSRTFDILAHTVFQTKTPLVWLEVFAGGVGGLFARYRPGKDPNPFIIRSKFHNFLSDKPEPPTGGEIPYSGRSSNGDFIVATDADVSIITHQAARVALDILEEKEPSSFPSSLYLIGLDRSWIFEAPYQTIAFDCGPSQTEGENESSPLSRENVTFLKDIIRRDIIDNGD